MPIEKIELGAPESQSADLLADNLAQLCKLFPELLTEGPKGPAINIDVLKGLVGDVTVTDAEEKYGLNWHGKRAARHLALTPSTGTLRPCPEESVDWDTTQNLMIEGDNLEVLKLLQKSYTGKVKLIYIDPPYNTGKDFVYPDNFQDGINNYLKLTGQIEGGKKISSNAESSGRFHTDWLNMIYPRLKLARNLLSDSGIIAVSIDDGEVDGLRQIMNEIFGEEQFQAQIIVQSNKRGQTYKQIARTHEFILIYSKSEDIDLTELEKDADALPYKDSKGAFDLWELRNRNPKFGRFNRPNLFFPIYVLPNSIDECGYARVSLSSSPESEKVLPFNSEGGESCWRWGQAKILGLDLGEGSPVLVARKRRDGQWNIYEKSRKGTTKAKSIWYETEFINEQGTVEMGKFGMGKVFQHPKPVALIQRLIYLATQENDLVLDFFAGSGTTGHAVMSQNSIDGGRRRYILVQLPEKLDENNEGQQSAFEFCTTNGIGTTISSLTKERLIRAGRFIKNGENLLREDIGFRAFKLDSSNIHAWSPKRDELALSLFEHADHVVSDRTDNDVLYELLLKLGLDLCVPIEPKAITGKTVQSIGGGVMLACLDKQITVADAEPLALGIVEWHQAQKTAGEVTCVFRDSAFENDVAKTNLAAILEQHGITKVRSL